MKIYSDSIIYIACPAYISTGGPEALHQLCATLNTLNFSAYMYYTNIDSDNPKDFVHSDFKKYNTNHKNQFDDNPKNILVVGEVSTHLLLQTKNVQRVIWWLSVNNYFNSLQVNYAKKKNGIRFFEIFEPITCDHFVQSEYAKQFLLFFGIHKECIYKISDYISDTYIQNSYSVFPVKKINSVLYNPKKGLNFTRKLIEQGSDIPFFPLSNLTQFEVIEAMRLAKVYIDFGNHPGKDRMPREAVLNHCCVITGLDGSAKYTEDIPIDLHYKFEKVEQNISLILEKIRYCIKHYENCIDDFSSYRQTIYDSKKIFENEVYHCFVKNITIE